ncbi:MAG TPA: gliding motility-associated C-terminal domain-containing protein [Saprospiraceae bacterium]|nr:gliding motility-associated C-terminal domain-containing protein [Saprospiraceae bacterium]HMT71726.1 gliding motility-associated C-terminal domain-containing protein [Saprospiraceae bacterium]
MYLFFRGLNLIGQENLVPNASFEDYFLCPNEKGQIDRTLGWFSPNNGSPDYYNRCSSDPLAPSSVPIHSSIYTKNPYDGNAYIGLGLYSKDIDTYIREYVSIELKNHLTKDKIYYSKFRISPIDSIPRVNIPCFIDKIGMNFSKILSKITTLPNKPISKSKYFGNERKILDKIDQWSSLSYCIVGGGEKFLTIGNFFTNEETFTNKECLDYFPNGAYYYIDDVGVYEFDPLPDTILLCEGQSKTIGQKFLDGTYQWNTGSQDSTIIVGNSGTYIVNVDMGSCILTDTAVVINMNDLDSFLPKDTTICDGTKLTVEIPIPGKYLWSIGSDNNAIEVSKEGLYSVQIENQCGTFTQSFNVKIQECECQVHAPNIFSPNADAINDDLIFYMHCQFPYEIQSLRIYDRWGSLVFDQKKGMENEILWNGKLNGNTLSAGVYCWVINYSYIDNGQVISKIKSGNVTIIH